MAPWSRSCTGRAGGRAFGTCGGVDGLAGAGEAAVFAGRTYSDSICAACSGVGSEAPATGAGALRPQPQRAHRHSTRRSGRLSVRPITVVTGWGASLAGRGPVAAGLAGP